ncbi:hypothetical protein MTO96_018478 [Rhipicephalus appendiculatus]
MEFMMGGYGIHDSSAAAPPLQIDLLREMKKILLDERPMVFDDCVEFARLRFQEQYNTNIREMLRVHPEAETLHMDYIVAAANLRAAMFGIPQCTDREVIAQMLDDVVIPIYDPQGKKAAVSYDRSAPRDDENILGDLLEELPDPRDLEDLTLTALEFDVDDESNFHVDFIVAASNLRAANFNIQPADRLESKLVAGKIIPAIATTTSLVAGLACLEIYKLVQGHGRPELYRNSFVNLALPFVGFSEPNPPAFKKFRNQQFSFWNCIEIQEEKTLAELLEFFRVSKACSMRSTSSTKVEVTSVLEGAQTLYDANAPPSSDVMNLTVSEVLERVSEAEIDSGTLALTLKVQGQRHQQRRGSGGARRAIRAAQMTTAPHTYLRGTKCT